MNGRSMLDNLGVAITIKESEMEHASLNHLDAYRSKDNKRLGKWANKCATLHQEYTQLIRQRIAVQSYVDALSEMDRLGVKVAALHAESQAEIVALRAENERLKEYDCER